MTDDTIMVELSEVQRRSGRDRRTIWRWFKRKGIRTQGRGVLVSELRAKWPDLLRALGLEPDTLPSCSKCGAPTMCVCVSCGENVS